jgi:bacterioferritin-associated ferredoxin
MSRQFPHSHIVCKCKNVSLGEIIHAIKEKGAKNLQEIENSTDAGSACSYCKRKEDDISPSDENLYLDEILKKFV